MTFFFTDIESSTSLLDQIGAEAYADALVAHRQILRDCCASNGGVEVDNQGDAFFFVFVNAQDAVASAACAQAALAGGPVRVRMGLHTGTALVGAEGYVGLDVHRAARIAGAGSGGQVVMSGATAAFVLSRTIDEATAGGYAVFERATVQATLAESRARLASRPAPDRVPTSDSR